MSTPSLEPAKIVAVQQGLLGWFEANRRDLPWRRTRDPYHVLVSEIMLQQTQVDRVLPYYRAFLERFPTVQALAAAPTAEVIKAWAGLGYNRRAVNLQRTTRYIVDNLEGTFPREVEALRSLPGIGPYTAGAVACFAYEQDVAFIDTNMRRVLHRLFHGVDVPSPTASDREILGIASAVVPPGRGWVWNQALIEFGALHCTARRPACVVCPLQAVCCAYPGVQSAIAAVPRGARATTEPRFHESNRYYRGRVLAALRDLPAAESGEGIALKALGHHVRDNFTEADVPWLYGVVKGLSDDGLAMVAEETPGYDGGSDEPEPQLRIRLP